MMPASDRGLLFDALVAASGLAPLFARTALTRALARGGCDPRTLTRAELQRSLPHVRAALRVYLTEAQTDERMAAVTTLASGSGRG